MWQNNEELKQYYFSIDIKTLITLSYNEYNSGYDYKDIFNNIYFYSGDISILDKIKHDAVEYLIKNLDIIKERLINTNKTKMSDILLSSIVKWVAEYYNKDYNDIFENFNEYTQMRGVDDYYIHDEDLSYNYNDLAERLCEEIDTDTFNIYKNDVFKFLISKNLNNIELLTNAQLFEFMKYHNYNNILIYKYDDKRWSYDREEDV